MSADTELKCHGCRRFVVNSASYCPYCGLQLRLTAPLIASDKRPAPPSPVAAPQKVDQSRSPNPWWQPLGAAGKATGYYLALLMVTTRACRWIEKQSNSSGPMLHSESDDMLYLLLSIGAFILIGVWLIAVFVALIRWAKKR